MKKIDIRSIFELNNQYKRKEHGSYINMFLEDFQYFNRNRKDVACITYSEYAKKKLINAENDEDSDKFLHMINRALEQLLLEGCSSLLVLDYNKNSNESKSKLLLCNFSIISRINCFKNSYFYNEKLKLCKIEKKRIIELKLSEVGYNKKIFKKPLEKMKKNHNYLMSDDFIYNNVDYKKIYNSNDIEEILLTKNIYWDCRKYDNNIISLPYLYYRKEKFYNIRVRIFKYIINKINKSLSKYLKSNRDFINISDKICEMDIYNQYIMNKITLNELQNTYYNNIRI